MRSFTRCHSFLQTRTRRLFVNSKWTNLKVARVHKGGQLKDRGHLFRFPNSLFISRCNSLFEMWSARYNWTEVVAWCSYCWRSNLPKNRAAKVEWLYIATLPTNGNSKSAWTSALYWDVATVADKKFWRKLTWCHRLRWQTGRMNISIREQSRGTLSIWRSRISGEPSNYFLKRSGVKKSIFIPLEMSRIRTCEVMTRELTTAFCAMNRFTAILGKKPKRQSGSPFNRCKTDWKRIIYLNAIADSSGWI